MILIVTVFLLFYYPVWIARFSVQEPAFILHKKTGALRPFPVVGSMPAYLPVLPGFAALRLVLLPPSQPFPTGGRAFRAEWRQYRARQATSLLGPL